VLSWSELPAEFPAVHIEYDDLINGKVNFSDLAPGWVFRLVKAWHCRPLLAALPNARSLADSNV
jgi:hypothetical protein